MDNLVLIHGAFHGGWCWRKTVKELLNNDIRVLTPTLTGLGERSHLLHSKVTLSTHVKDVVNILEYEDLYDVHLVGHSYAGMVITCAATMLPHRIKQLVYLDAPVPHDNQSLFDILPFTRAGIEELDVAGEKIRVLPVPNPDAFGVTDPEDIAWMAPRLTPMPYQCYDERVKFDVKKFEDINKAYLMCEKQLVPGLEEVFASSYRSAEGDKWRRSKVEGPHDCMVTHPAALAQKLLEISSMG